MTKVTQMPNGEKSEGEEIHTLKFKGTSGEWFTRRDDREPQPFTRVCVGNYKPVADCFVSKISEEEAEANAKLIAAAPNMLHALIELQKYNGFPAGSYQHGLIISAIQKALA